MGANTKDREQAFAIYKTALRRMLDDSRERRFGDVVGVAQAWIDQLPSDLADDELCRHAKRTIRGLGGMGGITDGVAGTEANRAYFESVDRLYRAANTLLDLFGSS